MFKHFNKELAMGTPLLRLAVFVTFLCTIRTEPCGEEPYVLNVTPEPQELTSPGWKDGKYPPNSYCIYNYNIPDEKYALVTFSEFQLEGDMKCKKDYLEMTLNGMGARSFRYCGEALPRKTLMFSGYYPQMLFKTDNSTEGVGFKMTYRLVDSDRICKDDELQCTNMNCVKKSLQCDGKDECGDGTDEENCPVNVDEPVICGKPKVEPSNQNRNARVIGGNTAKPKSWPWQVALQHIDIYPSGHQCGGVLINRQWVLTAGHCVSRYLKLRVKLGNHRQMKADEGEQMRYVDSAFTHPYFNPMVLENDIALLKMNAPIAITDTVQPICSPEPDDEIEEGTICYATGWGQSLKTDTDNTDDLQEVRVPIINKKECADEHAKERKLVESTNVCTGFKDGGHNPCYGDSGGPLVTKTESWTLVGVVSYGAKYCGDAQPAVYTQVSKYMEWIKDTIKENSS